MFKKFLLVITLVPALFAQNRDAQPRPLIGYTVAALPSAAVAYRTLIVTDGASSNDCTTGGGSTLVLCASTGSVWTPIGGSGSGSGNVTTSQTLTANAPILGNGTTDVIVGSFGAGITLSGTAIIADTGYLATLGTAQSFTAKKSYVVTGGIAALRCVESTAPNTSLQAADMYCDSTLHTPEYYVGGWVPIVLNPFAGASGQVLISGASGVPATFNPTVTGGYFKWGGSSWGTQLVTFAELSGTATAAQLPPTPLAPGTTHSLTGPREYWVCTATCTVTPPVPVAGYEFCVVNADNTSGVITMAALGSSARYEATARTGYGTAGTGTFVSGGAVADKVCIVGFDSTHYLTLSYQGTWVAN